MVESETPPQREALLHSSHLLVIALNCVTSPSTPETWELFKDCLIPCAKLAAVSGSELYLSLSEANDSYYSHFPKTDLKSLN